MPQGFSLPPGAFSCLIQVKYRILRDFLLHQCKRTEPGKFMPLHQIMYISTVVGTITPQECAEVAQLSAVNNQRDDVTGLLLFNSRRFLQVLEGPKDAVERIFARIYDDPRHRAVVKLREGAIDTREFGQWAMAYDDSARPSHSLKDKVAALLERAGPSTRAHFIGAADLHRPAVR